MRQIKQEEEDLKKLRLIAGKTPAQYAMTKLEDRNEANTIY